MNLHLRVVSLYLLDDLMSELHDENENATTVANKSQAHI